MEALAYAQSYSAYEEAAGIEYDLPELKLNWTKLPNSTWLNLLGVAVLLGSLSATVPASALVVNTPSGGCLNARTGPGTNYGRVTCVRNGASLKPVVATSGSWYKLSSGNWVYGPYTSGNRLGGSTVLKSGVGSSGVPVRTLQAGLRRGGYGIAVDGAYGPRTTAAVANFQAKYGLAIDGVAGPNTIAKMKGLGLI
ncbi:MAG: peptidoglycan-binding protein [Oscillatoria sp. PMC 1051.18]|nr:peptidoglycan-binding protein [Oscillatoria sp. PMC 1050.18]MEC5031396.1 peptidoglycan-binding protein [Oscillatoria sp. PMC 1051.18]